MQNDTTHQDSLNQATRGVGQGAKAAGKGLKTGSNLLKKTKIGKAGAKAASELAKKVKKTAFDVLFTKLKIYGVVIFVTLALLIGLITTIPSLIVNSIFHQSDTETLSDGRDFTYYGTAEEDFQLLSDTAQRAQEYILDVFASGEEKALQSLRAAASASGWVLNMSEYQAPTSREDKESMVMIYSAYSATMQNGLSQESFEYYQETSAVDDLKGKLDGLTRRASTEYPYGNLIHGADFVRAEDGSVKVVEVLTGYSSIDPETNEPKDPEYTSYVTPIVHAVNIEEVAVAAFFPEGITMRSPYEAPVEGVESPAGIENPSTYADVILDMSISMGRMLFGEDFWEGSNIFWGGLLGIPNDFIINTALSQEGQVGGQPYWRWWPHNARVEWCAIFVSWCADQCGYIDAGIIPKAQSCRASMNWFKKQNRYHPRSSSYTPKAGDIIYIDWAYNGFTGRPDHTGLVVSSVGDRVYTIEGNSGSYPGCVRQKSYSVNSREILGYASPDYPASDIPEGGSEVENAA